VQVGSELFLATSLELSGPQQSPVRLTVFGSYDEAANFLDTLNRLLLLLGLSAVLIGSALVFFISHTFTRPLASLVEGVRALEKGDFHRPVDPRGSDEVAELTSAFDRMRSSLLATMGRMASSITHDLRHSLAAIVANSEFLCDARLTSARREELYQELRIGVNQMTDLIDSLLEFARTRESLNPSFASVTEAVQRAAQAVRLHPRHQGTLIEIVHDGPEIAWFDPRKLDRALYNLLLNACEAAPGGLGRVRVSVDRAGSTLTISVSDNGPGIAEPIRERLFHPFVSYGKQNRPGLDGGAEDRSGSRRRSIRRAHCRCLHGFSHHAAGPARTRAIGQRNRRSFGLTGRFASDARQCQHTSTYGSLNVLVCRLPAIRMTLEDT
jgi:signal transduction histidine kinase